MNMRVGPGLRYSINWVYRHEGLPVEVVREFEEWRKVRDPYGTIGWIHKQMLQGKRTAIITKRVATLRRSPGDNASGVLRAQAGVTGRLLACQTDWCKMEISGSKGWIEKTNIWGAFREEKF